MIDELGEDKKFIEIIINQNDKRPYYEIKYLDRVTNEIHIGYSSYSLKIISKFLRNYFL